MRRPQPYYKKSHCAWYVNLNGKTTRLASGEEGEEAAYKQYDQLMADRQPVGDNSTCAALFDRFLEQHKAKSADATYKFYQNALDSFANFLGAKVRVCDLTPGQVEDWIDRDHQTKKRAKKGGTVDTGEPTTDNYRRNLIRAVKAAFRWQEKRNPKCPSPIRHLEMPSPIARDIYLTPEQFDRLSARAAKSRDGGALLDMITAMRETGCRPQEARHVESRYFDRAKRCWVFPIKLSKGKKERRVVLLTDKAFEICQRLALKYPEGPIFRTSAGKPWPRRALSCRLNFLSKKLGFPVCPYAIRHCFATDAILRGVDLQTIAILMGHKNLNMLSKVYQHVNRCSDHLRAGLVKAVGA